MATKADLLVLDLEMPDFDGLETIKEIKARALETKILVFTSSSKLGTETAIEALRLGATDFLTKPGPTDSGDPQAGMEPSQRIRASLEPKLQALFGEAPVPARNPAPKKNASKSPIWDILMPRIVVIGSSTGGPSVLEEIISQLSGPLLCPILIAQHMPPLFTTTFAERLGKVCGIPTFEAKDGMPIQKNGIYIAPGDFHLSLCGTEKDPVAKLDQGPKRNFVRPSADALFESAAQLFQSRCLAFVLTGMGMDGKDGAEAIKAAGGTVVIQDERSCTVFGMPGAVKAAGAFDRIATPQEIAEILLEKATLGIGIKKVVGG
jgi:two-component system chemotaxis response regulator CheB